MNDFERLLSESLKAAGEAYSPGDIWGAQEEFMRRRKRRRIALFTGAAAATGVAVMAALAIVSGSGDLLGEDVPTGPAQRVAVVGETIPVGDKPNGLTIGFDSVWVANTGDGTVSRIGGAGDEVETIRVGGRPEDLAAGPDAVWVIDPGRGVIHRIDPATNEVVAEIELAASSQQLDIAAGPAGVTAVGAGTIFHIDSATNELTTSPHAPTYRPTDVVAGDEATYFVGNGVESRDGYVIVLRCPEPPRCGPSRLTMIPGDAAHGDAVLGEENVIVSLADGRVFRFDLETLAFAGELADDSWVRVPTPGTFAAVSVGERFVWVLTGGPGERGALVQVKPKPARVIQALALDGSPFDLAVGEGAVWVSNHDAGTVTRLDLIVREPSPSE